MPFIYLPFICLLFIRMPFICLFAIHLFLLFYLFCFIYFCLSFISVQVMIFAEMFLSFLPHRPWCPLHPRSSLLPRSSLHPSSSSILLPDDQRVNLIAPARFSRFIHHTFFPTTNLQWWKKRSILSTNCSAKCHFSAPTSANPSPNSISDGKDGEKSAISDWPKVRGLLLVDYID